MFAQNGSRQGGLPKIGAVIVWAIGHLRRFPRGPRSLIVASTVRAGRRRATWRECAAVALGLVLMSAVAYGQTCSYSWVSIPNPPGRVGTAHAINNIGHVTGDSLPLAGEDNRGYIWRPETGTVQLPLPL